MNILLLGALIIFSLAVQTGCAHQDKSAQEDFFKEWKFKSEESQGYSPPKKEHEVEEADVYVTLEDEAEEEQKPSKPLPANKVTLKFREVDVRVIMRALARAADQNIIMSSNVSGALSINIVEMPWDQAFLGVLRTHGLDYVWQGDIIRVMDIQDMQRDIQMENVRSDRMAALTKQKSLEPLKTSVVMIRYADPETLAQHVSKILGMGQEEEPQRGGVFFDKHNNALVIQAIEDDTRRVLNLLRSLDQPRPQVLLKAHIVETTQDTARDLGIQWGGRYISKHLGSGNERLFIGGEDPIIDFPVDADKSPASLDLMFGLVTGNVLEMQLSALQSEGKLNILSSPSITTLDNQMAFTENGEKVPYVTRDEDGDPEVKFEDAVLRLEITPNIIDSDQMRLHVKVQKDEVDRSREVQGNPYIIKKQTETNLVVADSETIVISGLSKERSVFGQDGVPGLKDLPGLGAFFRKDSREKLMEEVLIFVTPHILPHRPPYSSEYK